jgi:hypothetical protein
MPNVVWIGKEVTSMLSIEMAEAHNRDLLDASAAAYAVRDAVRHADRRHSGDVRRRARALSARLRAR